MRIGKTFSAVNLKGLFLSKLGVSIGSNYRGLSLLVSSEYDPWSILEMTYPYLSGSASIVFHCPYLQVRLHIRESSASVHPPDSQVLVDLQAKMKSAGGYLGANITEAWKRKYQVILRLSELISSNSSKGLVGTSWKDTPNDEYVGHGRVRITRFQDVRCSLRRGEFTLPSQYFLSCRFDDPDAQAILIHRQKKRKIEKPVKVDQGATESLGEDVVMSESTEDRGAAS